ncbi:MAG: hypothetical protein AAFY83_04555 [Pseudomonadota bacterium]
MADLDITDLVKEQAAKVAKSAFSKIDNDVQMQLKWGLENNVFRIEIFPIEEERQFEVYLRHTDGDVTLLGNFTIGEIEIYEKTRLN